MKIVFATGNPGKIREAAEILGEGFELVTPAEMGITEDLPETGNTLRANSMQKADYIYKKTGMNCFADDSGLEVDILGGAPGVETARYAGPQRNADANIDKLLDEMARREKEAAMARTNGLSTSKAQRTARFRTAIVLIMGDEVHTFEGKVEGHILTERHGVGGFGYDPIFKPDEADCAFGEMSAEEKNRISHRGRAVAKLTEFLSRL